MPSGFAQVARVYSLQPCALANTAACARSPKMNSSDIRHLVIEGFFCNTLPVCSRYDCMEPPREWVATTDGRIPQ